MYNVSQAYKTALTKHLQYWQLGGGLGIKRNGVETSYNLTADNFVEGSLSIDIQNNYGDGISLGGVYTSQLEVTLCNLPSGISRADFADARIAVWTSLQVEGGSYENQYLNIYQIQEANWTKEGIAIVGYDDMIKLDVPMDEEYKGIDLHTPYWWAHTICTKCNLNLDMREESFEYLCNGSSLIRLINYTDTIKTWRDLLYYLTQVLAAFAYVDDGQLYIKPYVYLNGTMPYVDTINMQNSLVDSFSVSDKATKLSGYTFTDSDGTIQYYGADPDKITEQIMSFRRMMADSHDVQESIRGTLADLDDELHDLEVKYNNGEITWKEYQDQATVINSQIISLEAQLSNESNYETLLTYYVSDYEDEEQTSMQGAGYIDLPYNPFLGEYSQRVALTTDDFIQAIRWNLAKALNAISYSAFEVELVGHPGYQSGDKVLLDLGNSQQVSALVIGLTYDGYTLSLRGYGGDDKLQTVTSGEATPIQSQVTSIAGNVADLQNKMDSVSKNVSDGKKLVAAAITGKGVYTAADASFPKMAKNINKIETGSAPTETYSPIVPLDIGAMEFGILADVKIGEIQGSTSTYLTVDQVHIGE